MSDNVIVKSSSKVLETQYQLRKEDSLDSKKAKEIVREINESRKGKAIIENGELKVKDLLIG